MYYWIENQIEQIAESMEEFTEDELTIRLMSQGRFLEIEFMLDSDMITGYLTRSQIDYLKGYLKTIETIIF